MLRYLHALSAVLFYVLGVLLFGAYLFWHNGIAAEGSWSVLTALELPLLCAGLLYGGLSIYESVTKQGARSMVLGATLGGILLLLFIVFVALDFLPR